MKMGDLINVLKARVTTSTSASNEDQHAVLAPAAADPNNPEGFIPLNDLEVWNIFRQVVSGIRYLHYQNVVHGDIKPQVINKYTYM